MKRILYIAIALIAFVSCDRTPDDPVKDPETPLGELALGQWHHSESAIATDIYLSLTDDHVFELYQKVGDGKYRLYRGNWTIDEELRVIGGKYNDDEPWSTDYNIGMSEDGNSMTLTPCSSDSESYTYVREDIPEEVLQNHIIVVKSY